MHVADLGLGIYGANGIVAAGAPFAAGAAWSFSVDGSGRVAVTFFGDGGVEPGRAARDDEPRRALEAAARLRLREQRLRGHAAAGAVDRRLGRRRARPPTAWPPSRSTAWTSRRCSTRPSARSRAARAGGGPTFLECLHLPLLRAPHRRADDEARLPHRRGDRALARARPDRRRPARGSTRPCASAIDAEVEALLDEAVAFARESPRPDPADALDFVYASGLRPRRGVAA